MCQHNRHFTCMKLIPLYKVRYYYCPHLEEKRTKAQRVWEYRLQVDTPGLEPDSLCSLTTTQSSSWIMSVWMPLDFLCFDQIHGQVRVHLFCLFKCLISLMCFMKPSWSDLIFNENLAFKKIVVVLATWEAEIWKITSSRPAQAKKKEKKILEILSQ
jgi:hypothetical protein